MNNFRILGLIGLAIMLILFMGWPLNRPNDSDQGATRSAGSTDGDPVSGKYNMVTLLPRDAIPAIFEPRFLELPEANTQYANHELVLGVEINGDARAYSLPYLSGHEIVNDTVGGVPIAVTW